MRDVSDIHDELIAAQQQAVEDAFEAGRVAGRKEALDAMKARLLGVTAEIESDQTGFEMYPVMQIAPHPDSLEGQLIQQIAERESVRAAPNSVKPTIAKLIADRPGLATQEIRDITGFKPNSIRGTLWILSAQDKVIERREGRWYPVSPKDEAETGAVNGDVEAQKDEAAGAMSVEDTPTASFTGADGASDQPQTHG